MEVRGAPAYVIGSILVAVLPVAFAIGLSIGFLAGIKGVSPAELSPLVNFVDFGLVAIALVAVVIIAATNANK
ncbi:MAG TPA: hypothetical protein PKD54_14375 [Pirellulaceae bacterium]|nr:hypothetical protein [Pirellulaceae bacterium]